MVYDEKEPDEEELKKSGEHVGSGSTEEGAHVRINTQNWQL